MHAFGNITGSTRPQRKGPPRETLRADLCQLRIKVERVRKRDAA
jgi:hypothetical protein